MNSTVAVSAAPWEGGLRRTAVLSGAMVLALSAVCWVFAVRQMGGMDMGVATRLGSFGSFLAVWALMMAAMMLPSALPVLLRPDGLRPAWPLPVFVASYLTVWTAAGAVLYVVYRPHGSTSAGVVAIAAGLYELTPLKRRFRRACRRMSRTGLEFGANCVGSTAGLMLMMAAMGVMSPAWMPVMAVVVLWQKLVPTRRKVDALFALAIIGFGVLVLVDSSAVPGLVQSM